MYTLLLFLRCSFILVFILKAASLAISESMLVAREELSSYECGFEHHRLSRLPFSFRYFLLTLIFLLFDLEVILLLGVAYTSSFSRIFHFHLIVCLIFLLGLILGLLYEYYLGSLDWLPSL